MKTKKVWFVTGASKGLGLVLVKKLLQNGFAVAATSRTVELLTQEIGPASTDFLPLSVDLTDPTDVSEAITRTLAHFGQLDIVVNNAGYGQTGTLEEISAEEVKANFEINVQAPLHVIRYAMPHLRTQKSGHIFNISSVGGIFGAFPGWGIYCATKFAVAGFTEALAAEVQDFGVHATVVYPGYFRTDFLSQGSMKTPAQPIADYEAARASERAHSQDISGNQPNDPEKAADVLIAISQAENPPLHLLLGQDAYTMYLTKTDIIHKEVEQWKSLTLSTAY